MGPERRVILAVDVGSTAVRAAAFALDGTARHTATREYPLREPVPGWQVQDPEALVAATLAATSACVARTAGAEVVALALSSARYGLIGLDAALTPLTPLLTRRDTRSSEAARELRSSGQSRELHRLTGTPVHPMSPLCKLLWFARHEPRLCAATRWWVGLKDYVLHRLTGMLVTELSSASGTGLFDVHRRLWSPAVLDLAGVSERQLPPVLPTTAVLRLSAAAGQVLGLPSARRSWWARGTARRSLGGARSTGRRRADARGDRGTADGRRGAARRPGGDLLLRCADRGRVGGRRGGEQRGQRRAVGGPYPRTRGRAGLRRRPGDAGPAGSRRADRARQRRPRHAAVPAG
ncbi:hypothetical protein JM949_15290 [Micromonospora sp. STR1s_6]|uniref:Carbohydrate kinase FGGY N-terminal domain-containing protein n=1 Tax=Micromonospora tarensis TaxID=2806100 RepID=A0ABS1YH04_9ACTN|nr:hypothetical protein [Micromonospora tarensis]